MKNMLKFFKKRKTILENKMQLLQDYTSLCFGL